MSSHQLIEKSENIAKRNIFRFVGFQSGLTYAIYLQNRAKLAHYLEWSNAYSRFFNWKTTV